MEYQPKPEFIERITKLLGSKEEAEEFFKISKTETPSSIRCNTIKISPNDLKERLEKKGWKIKQPFSKNPEVMIIESELQPGELGKTKEHLLGYYYVQEITSMLPIIALDPQPGEMLLDLCASPGSKTTQAAAKMENTGTIIANDKDIGRISILSANLERCGVMNTLVTRHDGLELCRRLNNLRIKLDKILVDAPCSGEGTLRKSPKTLLMWSMSSINKLSRIQKQLASEALKILKVGGEMIYSTCTLAPEEDEEIINYLKENFDIEILELKLPMKTRQGICEWEGEALNKQVQRACRIYPHDNNADGFFLCKIKKISEERKLK